MIIAGFDPGFAFLGAGILEFTPSSTRCLHHETFRTSTIDETEERLDVIADRVMDILERWKPDAVGYENQAGVEVAAQRRREDESGPMTTASSRRVHEVVGIIRAAARFYAVPCYVVAPNTIKVAVLGKGGARKKKDAVKGAVRTIFRIGNCSEHAADAVAVAVATRGKHRQAQMLLTAHANLFH